MASRKPTAKELRRDADRLLRQQRQVLADAGTVLRAAGREAGRYAQDDLYPRFAEGTRRTARSARDRLVGDVIPSIASVVGSTMSVVDSARGRQSLLGKALAAVPASPVAVVALAAAAASPAAQSQSAAAADAAAAASASAAADANEASAQAPSACTTCSARRPLRPALAPRRPACRAPSPGAW
jgi:hypothetical protein